MANEFDNELETPDMETLSSLADNLVYRLPGCDNLTIRKTLQDVYRDFCRRSCCLCGRRHFVVTSDNCGFIVNPLFGGVVDSVVEVRLNGRALGCRDYIEHSTGRIILADRFIPSESCPDDSLPHLDIAFVEVPKIGSESIPSTLLSRCGDALVSGVLARLMTMTGKAWSDPAQGSVENIRYENAVNEERMRYHARRSSGDAGLVYDTSDMI